MGVLKFVAVDGVWQHWAETSRSVLLQVYEALNLKLDFETTQNLDLRIY
jgi:hypothetical protein